MAEGITDTGLTLNDYNTLLSDIQTSLNTIYAPDGDTINFGSETPDGQFTNIITQMGSDIRELITEVYNSFDPDKCSGVVQDSRYALNFLTRNGGTFTIQNIDIVTNQTVTLQGLDANYNELTAAAYTVSDDAGNLWYLIDTTTLEVGSHSLPFRSQNMGLVQPTIGTITNQTTTVLGVTSVNNSVAPTTLGINQESDVQFRIRRSRSTAKKGLNNIDVMLAQILDLEGVSDATTWVNNTSETDSTGTPAGYIWVIVEGGANTDIANTIYENGCGRGMRGEVNVDITALSGQVFQANFDRPTPIPLYIKFDFQLTTDLSAVNFDGIKSSLADLLTYGLNEDAETSKPTCAAAQAITANGGGGYALNLQISTNGTSWTNFIPSASLQNIFVVSTNNITINTIQEGS